MYRLPTPRPGQVLGLVGTNGIGKSTALKIMAGKEKPNLGKFDVTFLKSFLYLFYPNNGSPCSLFSIFYNEQNPPDWQEILAHFRGSELQNYFTKILEDNLKAIIKPQYVDHIPKAVKGVVGEIMTNKNEKKNAESVIAELGKLVVRATT
jgi:ATP-binding cassette subfamily E protein 1